MNQFTKKFTIYLFILLGLIITYFLIQPFLSRSISKEKIVTSFKKAYFDNINYLSDKVNSVYDIIDEDTSVLWEKIDSKDKDICIFVFENNSPVYWSSNEIFPEKLLFFNVSGKGIIRLGIGWYQYTLVKKGKWSVVALKTIYKDYPVSNKYIKDYYNPEYLKTNTVILTKNQRLSDFDIFSGGDEFIIGFIFKTGDVSVEKRKNILSIVLILIALMVFLLFSELPFQNIMNRYNSLAALFIFLLFSISFYFLFIYLIIPHSLEGTVLFKQWLPVKYFINSRGEAILFSFMILTISYTIYSIYNKQSNNNISDLSFFVIIFLSFLLQLGLFGLFNEFYLNTLKHSDIATGFLFRHDFIELMFVIFIALAIFLFQLTFSQIAVKSKRRMFFNSLIIILLGVSFDIFFKHYGYIIFSVVVIQLLFPVVLYYTPIRHNIAFLRFLLLLVIYSFMFSIIINHSFKIYKDKEQIRILHKLSNNIDSKVITSFSNVKNELKNDIIIKNMLLDSVSDEELTGYILDDYMNKEFYDYDVQLTFCRNDYLLKIEPSGKVVSCSVFFDNIKKQGKYISTDSTLMLIENEDESLYYLGEIPLQVDSLHKDVLYVELFSSLIPSDLGYPEVLVDENKTIDLTGYTLAKYKDGELIYQYGDFDYHSGSSFLNDTPDSSFFKKSGYIHCKTKLPDGITLVVSRAQDSLTLRISTFSILFVLFSIISFILYGFYYGRKTIIFLKYSFRARLQMFFVLTILILFIMLAATTMYYFFNTRNTVIINQLNEKTKSVLTELQYNFGKSQSLIESNSYIQDMLKELSMIFFTDINIYGMDGKLIATSRRKIFNEGLLSGLINPEGYKNIVLKDKLVYLNVEHIGKLSYFSSYVPITIEGTAISGILNLPYFVPQSKIKNTFFNILFSYLNLFVLIGILGTFTALLVSRFLTKPLSMLQKRLAETRLDKTNEPLEWAHDDEIGKLIEEYNKMVKKLEESAEILKKSEREIAWREIAQQIAHEIRNPLTPMKLNVQYLQKTYSQDKTKFDQKFENLTNSIITQIEALNEVASMFSDLARNSNTGVAEIDIISLLKSVVLLYNSTSGVKVFFKTNLQNATVMARETELLRVFNNLVKNAVQSINDKKGEVLVSLLSDDEDFYEIQIKDTGKGMDDDMKKKIFLPYFTTKTGGTGIGLAIVKNIITEIGGEITFSSEKGKGTVFVIKLKKA